jgi:hypothetical protein
LFRLHTKTLKDPREPVRVKVLPTLLLPLPEPLEDAGGRQPRYAFVFKDFTEA